MLNCKASLFDLDHTLLKVNTSFRFGVYLYREKELPFARMIYLLWCYACHLMGWITIPALHSKTIKVFFEGKSIKLLNRHVSRFLDKSFHQMQNTYMIATLKRAQSEGQFVAILSSAPNFLVVAIAKRLGVENCLATQYQIHSDGTIGPLTKTVQGEEKAHYAHELMQRLSLSPEQVAAYTDSYLDLPFLEAVGCPVAVNPSKILRRKSNKMGWKIID